MLWAAALCLFGCGPRGLEPRVPPGAPARASERVASGYYLTERPNDLPLPADSRGRPVAPKVTSDFSGVPTSNDWWSSLIWQYDAKDPYCCPMYAHPLILQARANGLSLGYSKKPKVSDYEYMHRHSPDVVVGLSGLRAADARVAGYSDWTVTAAWQSGNSELRATFGHGLPFVYFTRTGGAKASVMPRSQADGNAPEVWQQGGEWLGFKVGDADYVVFGPSGSQWDKSGDGFVSDLGGGDFFSVALLPDREASTVELFKAHAYAFVTDTKVSWKYDPSAALLRSTFEVTAELKQPGPDYVDEPLLALYRHQWLNTKAPLLAQSYASPRGEMRLLRGSSFTTQLGFSGVLPILPNVARDNRDDLEFYVKEVYWQDELFPKGLGDKPQRDTYWDGKSLHRLANVLQIADQLDYRSAKQHLLQAIKNGLEDWFDGHAPRAFYYDETWRTLIGVPEGFGSSQQLNDHHFHYGYFVFAAAIVARYDPAWAARWADYIDLLIKDAANWDRADQRFPFLRYMDVYAGHSWANGPALFDVGNNEESSSEDVNFSAAAILWGALTDNPEIRDLGIFLYTQQAAAAEQYWWDVDQQVFPPGFDHSAVAMVWGAGGRYDTWWDSNPIYIHGINVLPINGGSLYMGRHPAYVSRNYGEVARKNQGDPLTWRDVLWMYLALSEPERALELFSQERHFTPEFGNSRAMTWHWISNLVGLGQLDTSVKANTPTYAVFSRDGKRTHVAFNPTERRAKVAFSDGVSLELEPRQLGHTRSEAHNGASGASQ